MACGNCEGELVFNRFSSCDMYIRHTSKVHFDVSQVAKVFINLYDNAEITIKQSDIAKVYVYLHGLIAM